MPTLFTILLALHIIAGTATLLAAFVAIASKLADAAHAWHVVSGRLFFYGMAGIFVTALGMSLIHLNPPMLFVAIFSFYFAWMGRRYALNRAGTPGASDRIVSVGMSGVFLAMGLYGLYALYVLGEMGAIVIVVFGVLGLVNALQDWRIVQRGGVKGKARVAEHLGKMLGGTIAAVTAFLVVNVEFEPALVVWLLPTFVLTPLIIVWSRKIQQGVRRKGMPDAL